MQKRSPHSIIREQLEGLISRLPVNDAGQREALYARARLTIADKHPDHLAAFDQVVADLEGEATGGAHTETTMRETNHPDSDLAATPPPPEAPVAPPSPKNSGRQKALAALVGVAVLAVVAAVAWSLRTGAVSDPAFAADPEFDNGLHGYSRSATDLTPFPEEDAAAYSVVRVGDDTVVEASGPGPLYRIEAIEIDPAKIYKVTARLRVLVDDPEIGGARTYVGVATYDADGVVQTSKPGAHRYAALVNRVVRADEGWIEAEGILSGAGDENHNQFRDGTKTVRPLALLNYQSPGAVSQISYLRFEEIQTPSAGSE